ncbi:MAG: universal stress protein [Deltaproteobacteria bacterium]|nr:universal stress protein [Deltaproteobacteria bacterium]
MEFPCKYTVEFLIDIAAALAIQKDGIVVGLTVVKDDTGQHIVRANSVAAGIARAANSYDMVVIGAAPPQFFKHMLLGDIPEKVARHSSSPVIIIQKWQGSVSGLFRKLFG